MGIMKGGDINMKGWEIIYWQSKIRKDILKEMPSAPPEKIMSEYAFRVEKLMNEIRERSSKRTTKLSKKIKR